MKLEQSTYNPLELILNRLPVDKLDRDALDYIKTCLHMGGIECENYDDVITCINLLGEVGAVLIEPVREGNSIYYKVTSNYGR